MKNIFRITEWVDEEERIPCAGNVKTGMEWVTSEIQRIKAKGGTVEVIERTITREKKTRYEKKVRQVAIARAISEVKRYDERVK